MLHFIFHSLNYIRLYTKGHFSLEDYCLFKYKSSLYLSRIGGIPFPDQEAAWATSGFWGLTFKFSFWGSEPSSSFHEGEGIAGQNLHFMYRTVLWTLWERERVGRFGRMALKHVQYHVWNQLPVQVQCTILDAWGLCTGMTQRDGMGREWGEGSRWGTHVYLWWIHFDVWQN